MHSPCELFNQCLERLQCHASAGTAPCEREEREVEPTPLNAGLAAILRHRCAPAARAANLKIAGSSPSAPAAVVGGYSRGA